MATVQYCRLVAASTVEPVYIPRRLLVEDRTYSEEQLLRVGSVFIVLAEPGAGKTELLGRLGVLLGVAPVRASVFRSRRPSATLGPIVIDAMDEVARIDPLGLQDIIAKANDTQDGAVVFAGRSSEWDNSVTEFVKDTFGLDPVVVRLEPLSPAEQRQLFQSHFPGEVFDDFGGEADRFDLVPLFGNPQFLLLFGEAYVESARTFTSKKAIYEDAVRRLSYEPNPKLSQRGRPTVERIVSLAGEMFANLMLSGASGVSVVEVAGAARDFPSLGVVLGGNEVDGRVLTDSRLMKPTGQAGQHEPVHRIVAEYCAASYLVERIEDPKDRLSLRRVLAIAAPNGMTRTELRGMLGWMAALSREATQKRLARLDPYAVFANGDPSQLGPTAKKALLVRLGEVAEDDPFFRRGDVWRQFNVGGFFTPDIADEVAAILAPTGASASLRQLLVELVHSSGAASQFVPQLRALLLDQASSAGLRKTAHAALFDVDGYDPVSDLAVLHSEGGITALDLSATIVKKCGVGAVKLPVVLNLLIDLARLYPKRRGARDEGSGSRYFVRTMIATLDAASVTAALDHLTHDLTCTCKPRYDSLCECRVGISKVAGFLLDRHFALKASADPTVLWSWLRNLRFSDFRSDDSSTSVAALGEDDTLRRAIQWLDLSASSGSDAIQEALGRLFSNSTHSGIRVHVGDMEALAQRAFDSDNVAVWGALWRGHNRHDPSVRSNSLRTLQRGHARAKAAFLVEWGRRTNERRDIDTRDHFRIRSRRRRHEAREAQAEEENRSSLFNDRAKIEAGEHWGWLRFFAFKYLLEPEEFTANPDYGDTPLRAIRNCIPFLIQHIPTLPTLGARENTNVAEVLVAHCILRYRDGLPLDDVPEAALKAAATELSGYPTLADGGDQEAIESEFERLVFAKQGAPEEFARDFIEPALAKADEGVTHVHWLDAKPSFHHLRATLPIEWLDRYPKMALQKVRQLFEVAAANADRASLNALIDRRFNAPCADSSQGTEEEKRELARHRYWALNAFFYSTNGYEMAWEELRHDRENLIAIQDRVGLFDYDNEGKVPPLSSEAIYRLLDSFIDKWPKVPLPGNWGTTSPKGERAYRFLDGLARRLSNDTPEKRLPVVERLLADTRFVDFREVLLTVRAEGRRHLALQGFRAPAPADIYSLLKDNEISGVEDLRALLIEQLEEMQAWLKGYETDPLVTFYNDGKHVDENTGRNRVVDRLNGQMSALGLSIAIERHMAQSNRCDITVSATVGGLQRMLVVEVKGQWNKELFTAAAAQLMERYAIHPAASGQGVYLAFWFGDEGESIAGRADPSISSAAQLREAILAQMSEELKAVIDVFVLDVSRPKSLPKPQERSRATPSSKQPA